MDGFWCATRGVAWVALVGALGILVRAEALRSDLPEGVIAYTDITYRHAGGLRSGLDVYVPGPAGVTIPPGGRPAVVAIHGGGWRGGSKNGYGREVARLARLGYVVVSVDYVLSGPGRPTWPANLEDVREAVRWTRRNADRLGIDPDRIVALGSSAGGHLAAMLGTRAGGDDPEARVSAVVSLYGPTDLIALHRSPGAALPLSLYLGVGPAEAPGRYADASPITHASPGDAPTLCIHGEQDRLVPVSQSTNLADRLLAAGVHSEVIVVPEVGHGFGLSVRGRDLVPEVAAFLDRARRR